MVENGRSDQPLPKSVGRYEVQSAIGFGAMGAVYRAFDPLIKRSLAVKTIRLDIARDSPEYETFIKRFYHEARISGTLSHPNIVTLFDIGEDAHGMPFLAMEYVEGETVQRLTERGVRFKPEKVVGLVSQVASALDYAHGRGVIHRDIKPANLILFEEDRVKVMDFGIAKLAGSQMTQAGQLLGTPSYMSPEQAMGEQLDGRSDIFSLGVCAFQMLSGEQPFPGANVTSILYKLVHADPIEPANLEMQGFVPQKWHEVFPKVLAKKPEDRYQTGAEFVQDLEYCLGSWFGAAMSEDLAAGEPLATEAMTIPSAAVASTEATAEILGSLAPSDDEDAQLQTTPLATPDFVSEPSPPATSEPSAPPAAPEPPLATAPLATPDFVSEPSPPATSVPPAPPAAPEPPPFEDEEAPTVSVKAGDGVPDIPTELFDQDDLPPTVAQRAPVLDGPAAEKTDEMPVSPPKPAAPPAPTGERAGATVLMSQQELASAKGRSAVAVGSRPTPSPAPAPPQPLPAPVAAMPTPQVPGGPSRLMAVFVGAAASFIVMALFVGGAMYLRRGDAPATPPPPVTTSPTTLGVAADAGAIHVESEPSGAAVSVNGEAKGKTPLDVTGLAIGVYEVKVELAGRQTQTRQVSLTQAAPQAAIRLPLPAARPTPPAVGLADVRSTPPGAVVTINGKRAGESPLMGVKLKPGTHRVELSKPGHESHSETLKVVAGQRIQVAALLKPIPATPTPPPKPKVDTTRVYLERDVDTPAKKTSGASSRYQPKLKRGETVSVTVSWVVDEQGRVTDVTIVESGDEKLDEAVTAAIRKWKYRPATKGGVKVKVKLARKYTYRTG